MNSGTVNGHLAIDGENILWGWENFFMREEFNDAEPNKFKKKVHGLLIMFGGTDPSDYTRKILRLIKDDCGRKNIKIYTIYSRIFYCPFYTFLVNKIVVIY